MKPILVNVTNYFSAQPIIAGHRTRDLPLLNFIRNLMNILLNPKLLIELSVETKHSTNAQ